MGKISNNLITEKALRATRVNEALKNFFKAHGGTSTILYPRTVPEHIAYTSSMTSPSENSPNGYVRVSRRVLKDTPGKGTRAYTTSMFDKNVNRYVANALNKATGGKLFRVDRKTVPYDQNLPGYDNLLKKYQDTKKGNDYLIKRNVQINRNAQNLDPKSFYKQLNNLVKINGVTASLGLLGNLGTPGSMPLPGDPEKNRDRLHAENHPEDLASFGTAVPINDKGTLYINPDTGVTPTDIKIGSNGEEYYRVSPDKPLYKPVYGSGEAIEEDALNSLKDTHISADQLARNNIAKAKIANFNKTADYLNDIILGVIKNIPQDISKLPLPPVSADEGKVVVGPDEEVPAQPVQPAQPVNKPNAASVIKPPRRAPKPQQYVEPTVVNNTPVTPNVATPTLSSVASQAVRRNGGFDNYRRESVLSALRAAGGISPAEAVQRGIIPWEALNYV